MKYGAIAAVGEAVQDVVAVIAEAERKTIEAQDTITDTNDTETFKAGIKRGQLLAEQNNWTPEQLESYNEEQIKTYEDASGIQDETRRGLIQRVRNNRATIARESAKADANVLRAKRATEDLSSNYTNAVAAENWDAAEMFLEVGLETGAFKAPDVADKRVALDGMRRKEKMDARVEAIYQAYLDDTDKGDELYEKVARNTSMDDEDRTYILNEAQKKMKDAERVKKGEKADLTLQHTQNANAIRRGMLTGDDPKSTSDILAMDFGDDQVGERLKNSLWDIAFKIEKAIDELYKAPEGSWVDDEKHRKMGDQSVQATIEATRARFESEGGEWDDDMQEQAYVAASALQVSQHGVVPQSAADRLAATHNIDDFADNALLATVLLGEGARVDLNAGADTAKHYENIAAIIDSGERGTQSAKSIARSYWNANMETTEEEIQDIELRWEGKTNSQGHRYDSVEASIANEYSDSYIRDALGGIPGIDLLATKEGDVELVPRSQLEAIRARMLGAASRAYSEGLTEAEAINAGRLLLVNNAGMAYGLNVDEDGDPIHQVMMFLPPMVVDKPGTERQPGAITTESDHSPLRDQLIDAELPDVLDEMGEDARFSYTEDGQNYIVDSLDNKDVYFTPIHRRGHPVEYEVSIRDADTGTLSGVNVIDTETSKVNQLYLNTDPSKARQRAQLLSDLEVATKKRDDYEMSLKPMQKAGTATITLPPEAGEMSPQRIGFGGSTEIENFRRKAQKEVDIIEEKLRVHF